jgi:hypothetical protein
VQGSAKSEEAETYLNGHVRGVNCKKILRCSTELDYMYNAGQHYFSVFNLIE